MPKWKNQAYRTAEAAKYLGIDLWRFYRLEIPESFRTKSGQRRWWETDLDKWREENTATTNNTKGNE